MAQFSEEVRDGRCIVRVAGELDLAAVEDFIDVGRAALGRGEALELDLGDVTFIDSSGLGALVRLRKEADGQGIPLRLTHVNESTQRLLHLTGLAEVLDIGSSGA